MKEQTPLLQVDDLSVDFALKGERINAIDSISLSVNAGETVGIVGESGSGKSVTSLAIMGLIRSPGVVSSGSIKLFAKDLVSLSDRQRRKHLGNDMSMIFQDPTESLNPVMTIGKQISEVIKRHEVDKNGQRLNKKIINQRVLKLLNTVGMSAPEKIASSWPHQLSGGMNQRVMIAMAIACRPALLIADEPTTALDVTVQKQILQLLLSLQSKNKMGMIFISHDLSVVSSIADKILVMYAGQIVEVCSSRDLFQQAMHPYTAALLRSIPGAATNGQLESIDGTMPAAGEVFSGCRFSSRCQYVRDKCRQSQPELVQIDSRHSKSKFHRTVRCFFPLINSDRSI